MSRRAIIAVFAILAMLGPALIPNAQAQSRDSGTPLPDLCIPSDWVYMGTGLVDIYAGYVLYVYVGILNQGPGNSTSATVTLFDNGKQFATIPVLDALSGSGDYLNITDVFYIWNTSSMPAGNHTILISVMDVAGDANPSNNNYTRYVNVLPGPPPPTVVHLSLSQSTMVAHVSDYSWGSVHFDGTISVDMPPGVYASVEIRTRINTGWCSQASPSFFGNVEPTSHPFDVTVIVPAGAKASVVAKLTVEAIVKTTMDELVHAYCYTNISVNPYYKLYVDSDKPIEDIGSGNPATFDVDCKNFGNAVDDLLVTVDNRAELEKKGWTVSLNRSILRKVEPQDHSKFRLTVTPPLDLSLTKTDAVLVWVNVTSLGAQAKGIRASMQYPVIVRKTSISKDAIGGVSAIVCLLVIGSVFLAMNSRGRRRTQPATSKRDRSFDKSGKTASNTSRIA